MGGLLSRDGWLAAWQALGAPATERLVGVHRELLAAYAEPHRHYHTRRHLEECLEQLAGMTHLAERPAEVTIALWFHDAVYNPKRPDNEARSARWARDTALAAGVAPPCAERLAALVEATRHAAEPQGNDERVLVDIDLSILGAPPARWAEYEDQIRAEYAWVPGFVYRRRRRAILRSFLDRPRLYFFLDPLERPARANLSAAVARLGG